MVNLTSPFSSVYFNNCRFFDLRTKALEIESGAAVNEPIDYAIRSAIEYAVLKMVEKGEKLDYWKFKKWRVEE